MGLLQALQTLATYGSMMFVLMYGGTLVSKGEMSAGDLTSFMMYSAGLQSSMSMLSILQSEALKVKFQNISHLFNI